MKRALVGLFLAVAVAGCSGNGHGPNTALSTPETGGSTSSTSPAGSAAGGGSSDTTTAAKAAVSDLRKVVQKVQCDATACQQVLQPDDLKSVISDVLTIRPALQRQAQDVVDPDLDKVTRAVGRADADGCFAADLASKDRLVIDRCNIEGKIIKIDFELLVQQLNISLSVSGLPSLY